ncbi:trypsin-like peptidase domain-containing protein [Nocardia otitidiscaviarum]|uniref:S1 family peptidase n=1 Tax=Nocardia otitidiscaviarum TaxID=1823 RepID=UPI001895D08D|nr:serine protease [Nocardia otitidiscaviarum]MBF6137639.1 trypsin-like peptidase domain-containing protein [Nocardia otitidiscaviarum]
MSAVFPGAGRVGAAVARVLDGDGAAVGTGFVIAPGRVATCAHVVTAAVGPAADIATAVVALDFPLLDGAPRATARVHSWDPVRTDGRGDIALLELDDVPHADLAPPPLWRADRPWGREFRAVGFPTELTDGVWAWGEFRAPQGSGWLQLHAADGAQPLTGGFSGAPVWDAGSEAVVGMAVAADRRRLTRTAFMIPVNEVLGLDPDSLPNPYRGLEPFGENDSHLFYGRGPDIDRMLAALAELSVVAVVGRSGIGKSSLVRAGVVPRLRAEGVRVVYLSAETSWTTAEPEVSRTAVEPEASWTAVEPAASRVAAEVEVSRVPSDSETYWAAAEFAIGPAPRAARSPAAGTGDGAEVSTVLVADQFEELVATDPARAREQLGDLLGRAADPSVRLLLTLSWDVLEALTDGDLGHALDRATIALAPMGREQLRQAIRGPAAHAPGVDLDDDLVERLVDDTVGEPGGLPLLESVLTELWEQRRGGRLTLADYEAVGRAAASIARRAERVFGQFTAAADRRAARRLLTMLAAPRGDGFVRVPVSMRDVPELRSVAGRLARERLVVTGRGADDADVVELAHQSLIGNWPRLREWLESDRDFLEWQQRTERARRTWVAHGRDDGELPRGGALQDAEEWLSRRPDDIADPLREYVSAGIRVRRREVARWRVLTAVLAVLALVAAGAAAVAYRTGEEREQALRSLAGVALAERSLQLAQSRPNLALQFAQAAARLAPGDHTVEAALLTQQLRLASAVSLRTGLGEDVRLVAADRTAAVVAIGDGDGTVAVWRDLLDGGSEPWRLPVRDVVSLVLSADGSRLATVNAVGGVRLWDVDRRAGPFEVLADGPVAPAVTAISAMFSADGTRLVVSRDPRRSPVPVDHGKRLAADVGDPDTVTTFDTTGSDPMPLASYTAEVPSESIPVHVDSSGRSWFLAVDERGDQRYRLRAADGTALRPTDPAQGTVTDCGDGRLGEITVPEPTGPRVYGVGSGCAAVPPGAVIERDETGRYLVAAFAPESAAFQLVHLVDLVTRQTYKVQARYQSTGRPSFLVRPGAAGPELFVVGADDLTRHAPAAAVGSSAEFGADPTLMHWSADGRLVAEFHADAARVDLREVLPVVRPPTTLTLDGRDAARLRDMVVTVDGAYLVLGLDSHELLVYSIPELRPVARLELPVPLEYAGPNASRVPVSLVASHADEVAVLHAGYVSRWRVGAGAALGGPQQVWRGRADFADIAERATALRNGTAAGDLMIFTRRGLVIWDSVAGRRIRELTGSDTGWIDTLAKTLDLPIAYVWTEVRRVERWDLATGRIMAAPIAIPWAPLVELTPDDLIVTGWVSAKFHVLDAERGTLVNTQLPATALRLWMARTGTDIHFITDHGLLSLNLDRENILDRLCAVNDRAFTEAERELLPPGADATPPCSG